MNGSMDENTPIMTLGSMLRAEFSRAEAMRRSAEDCWIRSARQYAGKYEQAVLDRIPKDAKGNFTKSTVYIRHTKSKCDVLKARLMDLLFPSNNARNWDIAPSPKPEVSEMAIMQEMEKRRAKGENIPQDEDMLTIAVAEDRARAMSDLVADQLNKSRISYKRVCSTVIRSGIIYGTGCLKGPLIESRPKSKYVHDRATGEWTLKHEIDAYQPYFEFVPVFDLYPDPAASTPEQLSFLWQTHVMTRHDLVRLTQNPGFHGDVIRRYLNAHPDGDIKLKEHETELRSLSDGEHGTLTQDDLKGRFRVLERWGDLSGRQLLEAGMTEQELLSMFPDFDEEATYGNNIWMTESGDVLKCSLSPVEEISIPYYFFRPYADDSSFWGEGLPEIVRDPQIVINAAARMTLDNAAIACAPQIGVNIRDLAAEEDATSIYGGKIWLFDSSKPLSECYREIGANSHISELLTLAEKYSQWSDEISYPRYMSGNNQGVRGAGDTASGLSMLMSMASMPVKDMVSAFDSGVTEPFIRAMYRWNMRYSSHDEVKGDYEVVATGSTSLIAQELMGKRLLETMSVLTNPAMADMVDMSALLAHVLRSMDLPNDIQLTPEETKFRRMEQMKMEKAAQLQAVVGEMEKRNLPLAPELMNMAAQIISEGAGGGGDGNAA